MFISTYDVRVEDIMDAAWGNVDWNNMTFPRLNIYSIFWMNVPFPNNFHNSVFLWRKYLTAPGFESTTFESRGLRDNHRANTMAKNV